MEDYVLAGKAAGLTRMVFLEHFEAGITYFETTWLSKNDFAVYFEEGKRLQRKYGHDLRIELGVEVGYNPHNVADILSFLETNSCDQVGLSCHFIKINGRHYNVVSRKQRNLEVFSQFGVEKVINTYFEQLRDAVAVIPATMLCHLDAVLRYHPERVLTSYHHRLIDDILIAMAARNIALEVNTSGFRLRDMPFPAPPIIKRASELGVRLVAGSDAHRPQDVGRYFGRLPALLAQSGINLRLSAGE